MTTADESPHRADRGRNDAGPLDAERIAALVDGRLDEPEAARVRAQLADADDDILAIYADAVSHRQTNVPSVVAIPRRSWLRWAPLALGVAAAVVVAVSIRGKSDSYLPAELTDGMVPSRVGVVAPAWDAVRGDDNRLPAAAQSVRIGALLVDFQASVGNDDKSRELATRLTSSLDGVTGGSAVGRPYRLVADGSARGGSQADRIATGRRVMRLLDMSAASIGAYLEAVRLAISSGDLTFVDKHPPPPALANSGMPAGSPEALVLTRFNELVTAPRRDPTAIAAAATDLLRLLAR